MREQQEVRIQAAPAPRTAVPLSPRLSNSERRYGPTASQRTSIPSARNATPSAAPSSAASARFCCHWRFPISTFPAPSKPLCTAPVPLGLILRCDLRIRPVMVTDFSAGCWKLRRHPARQLSVDLCRRFRRLGGRRVVRTLFFAVILRDVGFPVPSGK